MSDLRFALRLWARHPTLLLVAGLSLGLGIGATTTMYSLLGGVARYDFGFADEDRLVVLTNTQVDDGAAEQHPTYDVVQALLASGRSFEALGLHQYRRHSGDALRRRGDGARVADPGRRARAVGHRRGADPRAHLSAR